MAEQEVEGIVFHKPKLRHGRAAKRGSAFEEGGEHEDAADKVAAAKLEQKMKKRTKGLVAVNEEREVLEDKDTDVGIGTEFMEQTSTTELDKARER
jgi:hypothetical protein